MNVLSLERAGFHYGPACVLSDISLAIAAGEMLALVGPSGSGKTTLAHLASGLKSAAEGHIERNYRRHGVVFQEPRLLPWLDARDNIAFPLRLEGVAAEAARQAAERVAHKVSLPLADLIKLPDALSGGMRQRVAIARALIVNPDFVIFDEPFSALDTALRRRMQDLVIATLKRERFAGLFITHDVTEAARLAHRIAVLDRHGQSILGTRTVPGQIGSRNDDDLYAFVQSCLREDTLFEGLRPGETAALS